MTTKQLAQRLMRNLTVADLAQLPSEGVLELLDAINSAIQQFYGLAPTCYKRQDVVSLLTAPSAWTGIGLTAGGTAFTGRVAVAAELWGTLRISGSALDYTVASASALLEPWGHPSATYAGTFYDDALVLSGAVDRVLSPPMVDGREELKRDDSFLRSTGQRGVGRPSRYAMGYVAGTFLLRFDPLPDQQYRILYEAELAAPRVEFRDLEGKTGELPVADTIIETCLLPLAAAELVGSPLWKSPDTVKWTLQKAEKALNMIERLPSEIGKPAHRVGTRRGY
ncbi:MAG: hypothetical protein ACOYMV_11905 [Verrucomicrobiia bacterium]